MTTLDPQDHPPDYGWDGDLQAVIASTPTPAVPFPHGVILPTELIEVQVEGLAPGASAEVQITLPPELRARSYYKYGRMQNDELPQLYEFLFDGTTGAEVIELWQAGLLANRHGHDPDSVGSPLRRFLFTHGMGSFDLSERGRLAAEKARSSQKPGE